MRNQLKMINRLAVLLILGIFFSQASVTFNFESQYGDGTNINDLTQDESEYSYLENLIDINFSYNNLFLYTQLEYSDPPIYGYSRTVAKDMLNTYVLEYSHYPFILKYGHIQALYGYGLAVNMFQDQITDFDNRVKGIELNYSPSDMVDFFAISGNGNYGMKSSGNLRGNDLFFDHDLHLLGGQFYTFLGDVSLILSNQKTYYQSGIYNDLIGPKTRLAIDLEDYWLSIGMFSEAWDSLSSMNSKVDQKTFNFSYSNTLGNFDIYIENSLHKYNKILRNNDIDGRSSFVSVATDFFGVNFLYEFKDYDMLYYMPITSNPPLVLNETASVLVSRNQHAINFSDEIGHQFESRFNFKNISFLMNLSLGRKHSGIRNDSDISFDDDFNLVYGIYAKPKFSDLLSMDFMDEDLRGHKPFRDFYLEGSGWNKHDNFYYKLGYHSHYSYDDASGKNYQSQTIPTQFVYSFKNNNSITLYYETQKTKNLIASSDSYISDTYDYNYISLSYHFNNLGAISYFIDNENKLFSNGVENSDSWEGFELSFELSSSIQLSIFKGSQKGGLVCANGICAVQPSFQDGVKVTLRALF